MKKINYSKIPFLIGIINWMVVIVLVVYAIFVDYKKIPHVAYRLLTFYLNFSFIPAIISLIFSKQMAKDLSQINIFQNIAYLILYTLVFLFFRYAQMGI